jgi:hypothetical protein
MRRRQARLGLLRHMLAWDLSNEWAQDCPLQNVEGVIGADQRR